MANLGEQYVASMNASATPDDERPTIAALRAKSLPRVRSEGFIVMTAKPDAGSDAEFEAERSAPDLP